MTIQILEYMLLAVLMKFLTHSTNLEDWQYIPAKSNVTKDAT